MTVRLPRALWEHHVFEGIVDWQFRANSRADLTRYLNEMLRIKIGASKARYYTEQQRKKRIDMADGVIDTLLAVWPLFADLEALWTAGWLELDDAGKVVAVAQLSNAEVAA